MRLRSRLVPFVAMFVVLTPACSSGESSDAPSTTTPESSGATGQTGTEAAATSDPALMSVIEVTVAGDVEDTFTLNGECTLIAGGEEGLAVDVTLDAAAADDSRQFFHSNPIDGSGLTVIVDDAVYQTASSQSEISGTTATVTASGTFLGDPSREVSITAVATGCTQ